MEKLFQYHIQINPIDTAKADDWCKDNFGFGYTCWGKVKYNFYFTDSDDAMAFKLRWS